MNLELLVKVGDSQEWRDGDVITVKGVGVLILPAMIAAWIQDSTVPDVLATLPRFRRQQLVRRLREMRHLHLATVAELAALLGITSEVASQIKERNASDVQLAGDHGLDSNWGWGDLRSHLAITVTGLSAEDLQELTVPDLNELDWLARPTQRRSYRLSWRAAATAQQIAAVENPAVLVPCRRQTTLDASALSFG